MQTYGMEEFIRHFFGLSRVTVQDRMRFLQYLSIKISDDMHTCILKPWIAIGIDIAGVASSAASCVTERASLTSGEVRRYKTKTSVILGHWLYNKKHVHKVEFEE